MPSVKYVIVAGIAAAAMAGCAGSERASNDPPPEVSASPQASAPAAPPANDETEPCPTTAPAGAEMIAFLTERSGLTTDYWVGEGLDEKAIWAAPSPPYQGRWYAGGEGMQIIWYRDALRELALSGRQLGESAEGTFSDTIATGEEISDFVFPEPGCWAVTAESKSGTATFVVEVLPESADPSLALASP